MQIPIVMAASMIKPTITMEESCLQLWDVIVVGAGPAGGMAALLLSRSNLRVLLVDRQCFPRQKVCGCCLNGNAVAALQDAGLFHILTSNNAVVLEQMNLSSGRTSQTFPLRHHWVLSRERFDSALIEEAIQNGASFLDDTTVELREVKESFRVVRLKKDNAWLDATAKVVIAADGLGSRLLVRNNTTNYLPASNSRIGAGVIIEAPPEFYPTGKLFMTCGKGGYLGLVRLEDGRLDLAAAVDPVAVKKHGGIGNFARVLLMEANLPPIPNLEQAPWRGTPALSGQVDQVAGERVFAIGDAAGYVEPFTGEGMAWALAGASLLTPLVAQAVISWHSGFAIQWQDAYRVRIQNRQGFCKAVSRLLRWPGLARMLIRCLKLFPFLSSFFVARLDKPAKAALN